MSKVITTNALGANKKQAEGDNSNNDGGWGTTITITIIIMTITTAVTTTIAFCWHRGVRNPPIQSERTITQGREFRRPSTLC